MTLPEGDKGHLLAYWERQGRPQKVTICGSTRFKNGFLYLQQQLSIEGALIYSVEVFGHADGVEHSRLEKATLDALHLHKILESDLVVVVVDEAEYVGESTEREIEFARLSGVPVLFVVFNDAFLDGVDVDPIKFQREASSVPGNDKYIYHA